MEVPPIGIANILGAKCEVNRRTSSEYCLGPDPPMVADTIYRYMEDLGGLKHILTGLPEG